MSLDLFSIRTENLEDVDKMSHKYQTDDAASSAMAPSTMAKKGKGKKASDPNETSKLLAAKISQLEQDAAGEKDQEAEIGMLLLL